MTKVATANLPARKMTDAELTTGITAVLDHHPRYLALQEVGPDRNSVLRAIGQKRGYRVVRAKGGPPVLYEHATTEVLRTKRLVLSRSSFVGHLVGRKSTLPASIATEVVFEDDELGEGVIIDAHLDAEVQFAGRYRTDKAHRPRVRRHKRQCHRIMRRVRRHLRKGRWVKVCMDGNFDGLELPPLVSCWAGRKPLGTLGGRSVDIVFSESTATDVRTVVTGSDHRAVVAIYR